MASATRAKVKVEKVEQQTTLPSEPTRQQQATERVGNWLNLGKERLARAFDPLTRTAQEVGQIPAAQGQTCRKRYGARPYEEDLPPPGTNRRRRSRSLVPNVDMLDPTASVGYSLPWARQGYDYVKDKWQSTTVAQFIAVEGSVTAFWARWVTTILVLAIVLTAMLPSIWGGFGFILPALGNSMGQTFTTRDELTATTEFNIPRLYNYWSNDNWRRTSGTSPDFLLLGWRALTGSDGPGRGEGQAASVVRRVAAVACLAVTVYHFFAGFREAATAMSQGYKTQCDPFGAWPGDFLQLVPPDIVDACGILLRHKLERFFKMFGIQVIAACCIFALAPSTNVVELPDKLIGSAAQNLIDGLKEFLTLVQRSELHDLSTIEQLLDPQKDTMPVDYRAKQAGGMSETMVLAAGIVLVWLTGRVYTASPASGLQEVAGPNKTIT